MPLTQLNGIAQFAWTLVKQTALGPNTNGPQSEGFTLAGLDLTVWDQLYTADIVLLPKFTITGDVAVSTTISNVSPTDIAKLVVGQVVTGTDIPAGTHIVSIGTTSFTISNAGTGVAAGTTITVQIAPYGLAATVGGSGTLAAGTYYYVVTVVGTQGTGTTESIASNEVSAVVSGSNAPTLTWTAVTGASAYNIYRGTISGSENLLVGTVSSSNGLAAPATTFTDTGFAGSAQSPPGASPNNYLEFDLSSFTNQINEATITPTKILGILVLPLSSYSDPTATCVFAPGTTNGLTWFFGGTTPTITVPIGGAQFLCGPATAVGQTIDSTHKTLRITNNGYGPLDVIVVAPVH